MPALRELRLNDDADFRVDVSAKADTPWDRTVAFYRRQGFELTGLELKLLVGAG